MKHRLLIWILWPSFLVAGMGEGLIFTVVNPEEIIFLRDHPGITDEGIYTIGFFMSWTFCAVSSALTAYILPGIEASNSKEVDRGLL